MLTGELRKRFPCVGMDLSFAAVARVADPRCQADLGKLPFDDSRFDAVVATEVLEHIPTRADDTALDEMVRTARKWVLVTVPYCEDLEDSQLICPQCRCRFHRDYHVRSYRQADIDTLFARWPNMKHRA